MTLSGSTFSTYLKTVVEPMAQQTFWLNNELLDGRYFEVIPPNQCPAGTYVNVMIDYASSTNAAAYTVGDPMVVPGTTSSVLAQFNKDYFQESAKTYNYYKWLNAGREGSYADLGDQDMKEINLAAKKLRKLACTTMLSDLESWIDSAANFSDAALARGTYTSLVSYEDATVGTLTEAVLADAVEALTDSTYGPVDRSDLLWVMDVNMVGKIAALQSPAYNTFNKFATYDAQSNAPIDGGTVYRTQSWDGIPIAVMHDFSTTDILLVNKSKIKVYNWAPLTITPKDVAADENAFLLTFGACLVVEDPRQQGKLDAVTP
jgi:hypothetical protein